MANTQRSAAQIAGICLLAGSLFATIGVVAHTAPAAGAVPETQTSLAVYLEDYVDSLPGRDSEAYVVPTAEQAAAFGEAVRAAAAGKLTRAELIAAPFGYGLTRLHDSVDGRRYVVLHEERRADGTRARNWGLYVLRVGWTEDLLVEVAHPLYDIDSHHVGLGVFSRANGRALFIAGGHRYANADHSSDVAHAPVSAFESAHRAVLRTGSVVYQPHGFSAAAHPDLGDAVVSGGAATPSARAAAVAKQLSGSFSTCLFDGILCRDFGATTNVQGKSTRAKGASFVHVEHARPLRSDPVLRADVVTRTVRGLR